MNLDAGVSCSLEKVITPGVPVSALLSLLGAAQLCVPAAVHIRHGLHEACSQPDVHRHPARPPAPSLGPLVVLQSSVNAQRLPDAVLGADTLY